MNNNIPAIIPSPPRKLRKRRQATGAPTPPPVALTLVAAAYEEKDWVRLTFDRAIDISALDPTQVVVNDGALSGEKYIGTGSGALVDPQTVQIDLTDFERSEGELVLLNASDETGIIAEDGGAWAGVTGVELPFP